MNRIWKVACILFAIGFTFVLAGSIEKSNENEEYYKHNLMKYIVSANEIVTIIIRSDETEADYEGLYNSLLNRIDRIERFINASSRYIGFEFSP